MLFFAADGFFDIPVNLRLKHTFDAGNKYKLKKSIYLLLLSANSDILHSFFEFELEKIRMSAILYEII